MTASKDTRLVSVLITFFNEGEKLGEDEFFIETGASDDEIQRHGHLLADISPLDDVRIPDRYFEMEISELDELPSGEVLATVPNFPPQQAFKA